MFPLRPRHIASPEVVSVSDLYAYGELMSLLWRAKGIYGSARVATQRAEIQTAVNLGFFGVAYEEGTAIGYFTYAMVSDDLQMAYLRGEVSQPPREADWYSGDNIWIISAVSPHARAGLKITRFIVDNMPVYVRIARALRVYDADVSREKRIVEWYRHPKTDKVMVRTKTVDALIRELGSEDPSRGHLKH